jgi:hypothetical protein
MDSQRGSVPIPFGRQMSLFRSSKKEAAPDKGAKPMPPSCSADEAGWAARKRPTAVVPAPLPTAEYSAWRVIVEPAAYLGARPGVS